MSTELKFKNIFGQELTKQQVLLINDAYHQEQYVDGELKRIDLIEDNQIDSGIYYLSTGENLQVVLNQLQSIWKNGYFYIDTQIINGYTVKDWEIYEGLVKVKKGQTVYDSQGREIAEQVLDISTLSVINTTKKYYLESFGSFNNDDDVLNYGILEFHYKIGNDNSNEQIIVMVNLPGFDHRDYIIDSDNNILLNPEIMAVFSWNDQGYYKNSSPFIPPQ